MRAEVEASAAVAPENAAVLAAEKTSTSCGANVVERPSFLLDEKDDVSSTTNDEDADYKLLYLRSEMLRTEALLKDFWNEEARRKLRIELIQKDVELYEQQYKMKRLLQSQSESPTLTPASTSTSSSQTEPVNTTMTSQETQTELFEEEYDIADNLPSAARTEDKEEEEDAALEKDEASEEPSIVEIYDTVDESPTANNTGMDIDVESDENKADAKKEVENELTGDGQQKEEESPKEEETEKLNSDEECAQDTGEDQDNGDNDEKDIQDKQASTPLIAMDSPDFMSKIAMRFKALDDEFDETKSNAADETKPEEDTEAKVDNMNDISIEEDGNNDNQESVNAGDVSDEGGDEDADALDTSISSDIDSKLRNFGRAETRPRTKAAAKKDKRKKRVTGGGTSTLYSTFKPPQLKNNKRQRRRR